MQNGEKLTILENIVYEFAHTRLMSSGLDETLANVVMGNVYRRFQESAYQLSLINQLKESAPSPKIEKREGTVEDLMEDLKKNTYEAKNKT